MDGTGRANTIATYPQDAQIIGGIPIMDGEWHHIVSVHEVGSNFMRTTLYVDNQFERCFSGCMPCAGACADA